MLKFQDMKIKQEKIKILIKTLNKLYPNAKCFLNFNQPHELLIATRLSAQCTDKKVNLVTKELFKKFNSLEMFSNANFMQIYKIIKPCGLGNKKANDIINASKKIVNQFNSKIPNNMTDLLSLPGVGRKTANLILATLFNEPTIVVDTHVLRTTNRIGLVETKNTKKIEFELLKLVPKNQTAKFCHCLVEFGRNFCKAQNPNCKNCPIICICKQKINYKN